MDNNLCKRDISDAANIQNLLMTQEVISFFPCFSDFCFLIFFNSLLEYLILYADRLLYRGIYNFIVSLLQRYTDREIRKSKRVGNNLNLIFHETFIIIFVSRNFCFFG